MQLRTFLVRDMREALANVRSEMGPEAVIVGHERARGGGILVRAALDDKDEGDNESIARELAALLGELPEAPAAKDGPIRHLHGVPREKGFSRPELLSILRTHRVPDGLAHMLAETAQKSGLHDIALALAFALDRRMKINPIEPANATALLLAGPVGAGKSVVAAKIANQARLIGREVNLVASDVVGAGAVARLETFANQVGANLVVAGSAETLAHEAAAAAEKNILSVIDTKGFDPRHVRTRTAFSALGRIDGVETIGVVSAAGDAEETAEISAALAALGAKRVIVTGFDLVRRAGAVLAAATQDAGLAHVTRSPFVGSGLETLTPLSLARFLIDAAANTSGNTP